MNINQLQGMAIPAMFLGYLLWRYLKFKKVKSQIPNLLSLGAVLVDVRSKEEFAQNSRPNSINIPLGDIALRQNELDKNKTIVLCCASGARSAMAANILKSNGFKNIINAGPWTNTL